MGFASAIENRDDITRGLGSDGPDDADSDGGDDAVARRDAPRSPRTPRESITPRSPRSPRTPRRGLARVAAVAAMWRLRALRAGWPRRDAARGDGDTDADVHADADVDVEVDVDVGAPAAPPGIARKISQKPPPPLRGDLMRAMSARAAIGKRAAVPRGLSEAAVAFPNSQVTPHPAAQDGDALLGEGATQVAEKEEAVYGTSKGDMPQASEPRSSDASSARLDVLPGRAPTLDLAAGTDADEEKDDLVNSDAAAADDDEMEGECFDDSLCDEQVVMRWLGALENRLGSERGVNLLSPNTVANPSGEDGLCGWKHLLTGRWKTEV